MTNQTVSLIGNGQNVLVAEKNAVNLSTNKRDRVMATTKRVQQVMGPGVSVICLDSQYLLNVGKGRDSQQ